MREHTRTGTYLCLGKRRWALGRVFSGLTAKPIFSLSLPFLRIEIALLHLEAGGWAHSCLHFVNGIPDSIERKPKGEGQEFKGM